MSEKKLMSLRKTIRTKISYIYIYRERERERKKERERHK